MKEFLIIRDGQKFKEAPEPSGRQILQLLSIKEMSVDKLAEMLEKDVSTIYRHVNKLETAGLVEVARKEQVGPVSKKYYRRAAKIIIGLLPPEETFESEIFRKYSYEKMRKGLLALKGFRYNIPEDNTSLGKLAEIALEWDKLWDSNINAKIVEEKMVGDIPATTQHFCCQLLSKHGKTHHYEEQQKYWCRNWQNVGGMCKASVSLMHAFFSAR